MKVKCEYCGSYIDRTAEKCENCGAVNLHQMRSGDGIPKTIPDLLAFAKEKNLPLKEMRFFIGENCTEPRAFGIYKEQSSGNFVVYKNKSDGSRAIRYEGTDEAYAVNEIYQKMRSEVMEQKADLQKTDLHSKQSSKAPGSSGKRGFHNRGLKIFVIFLIIVIGIGLASASIYNTVGTGNSNNNGYYYNNDYDSDHYDNDSDWDWDYGGDDDTYYDDYDSWADDWDDDDWDWDSGDSWDSGGSDWDSDW